MKARPGAAALLASLLCTPIGASAAVYRCGNIYTDVRCPDAAALDVDDRRSDADRSAAKDVARREAALAARMTADRERAEALATAPRRRAAARPAAAASSPAPKDKRTARLRWRVDPDGNFMAIVPAAPRSAAKP